MQSQFERHIEAAISCLNTEIKELENAGTRPGSVDASITGGKYRQFHWCHDGKRKYVSKKNLALVRAECNRYRTKTALQKKIDILLSLLTPSDLVQTMLEHGSPQTPIKREIPSPVPTLQLLQPVES